MQIEHELVIPVDVDTVWAMTIDVERWPSLTPTMTSVERLGDEPMGIGSQARIVQPKQRPRVWTVTRFEPGRHFEWSAEMGTVTMTGGHHLEPVEGGTRNRLTLQLSGFGSRLLLAIAGKQLLAAITTENEGFAAGAGARVQPGGSTT